MAEIFGAVASGIGIAGVAAQAIDGIRKLQTFCNDVRDAPEEITYMTNELEILLSTIAGIEAQIQRNASICQTLNPTSALRFVDQSVNAVNAVIQKLNVEIAQKRKLGSIKAAWKKKVLEAHMVKIERSKTSLGLAVSAYSTELYLQTAMKTNTRIDLLSTNLASLTTPCQAQLMPARESRTSDDQQIVNSQQHLVDDDDDAWQRARKIPTYSRPIQALSFSLILPRWLAQYSLQLSICRSAQSWTLNLKQYRTVPCDCELWDAIEEGDFNRMRHLIATGQATVFDRDETGLTVLHVLADCAIIQDSETFSRMARFSIEHGADVNEPDRQGVPAICHLAAYNFTYVYAASHDLWNMEVFRLLADGIDLDPEFFWGNYGSPTDITLSPAFEGALKRIFPLPTMEYPKVTLAARLACTRRLRFESPQDLAMYLDIDSLEAAYPRLEESLRRDVLHVALNQWAFSPGWLEPSEEWGKTFQALLAARAKLGVLCIREKEGSQCSTEPGNLGDGEMGELIRNFVGPYVWGRRWCDAETLEAQEFFEGFQYFLSKTAHLGIKLETISSCRRFDTCFDECFMQQFCSYLHLNPVLDSQNLSLYYDDGLSTWVMWNSMYEKYCGEFWDLLEHPERMMPGTWID